MPNAPNHAGSLTHVPRARGMNQSSRLHLHTNQSSMHPSVVHLSVHLRDSSHKGIISEIWSLFVSLNCRLDLTHMAPWGLEQEWAGHPKVSGYTLWVLALLLKCHPWLPRVRNERSLPLFPVSTSASALHPPDSSTILISLTPPKIYPCCAHFQECPSFSSLLGFPQN